MIQKILFFIAIFHLQAVASPPLQHASTMTEEVDLDHYWVSEKLDGVRGYWDGNKLVTRQGTVINTPSWFINSLPTVKLDGELWIKRQAFEQASAIVRKHDANDEEWRQIKFMVFDMPDNGKASFNNRLKQLSKLVTKLDLPHLKLVPQFRVKDHQQLMTMLDDIVRQGGEGLMLHNTSARYRSGRTKDLLKVKLAQDNEAMVVDHIPGKGKFSGMMGAMLVELADGKQFKIGSGFNRNDRVHPPTIGSKITFKHYGYTKNGIPRFASYLRPRQDF